MVAHNTRHLLLIGFGGLLLLMAVAGIDAVRVLRTIQHRDDSIRAAFLDRNRLLNELRSDLYLSGTYVRDYLLEPDPAKAETHRSSLETARRNMDAALRQYRTRLSARERAPFANLERELASYWQILQPVTRWQPEERRVHGYPFLRDEVYPRRTAMLSLADDIGAINERQLDAGAQQLADLFSSFRLRLLVTVIVTLAIGGVLALLSIRRLLTLERESAARFQETAQARTELQALSARLVEAQETERRAISRELHDEVGQSLSALVVGLTNLAATVPATAASELARQIEQLRRLAQSAVGVVRNMTLLLRPSMLDDLGLIPALQWQAREVSRRSGLLVEVVADDIPDTLPDDQKTAIYRVVQEALHNCEKHSQAQLVRITVRQHHDALLLSVQDDGRGFSVDTAKGLGLRGMQERIANLGGMFNVESQPGHGALLTVRLPLLSEHTVPL